MIKTKVFVLFFFLFVGLVSAQEDVEMADKFYTEGKVYVVVVIVSTVVLGILAYLFLIDRKLSRIEKEIGKKN